MTVRSTRTAADSTLDQAAPEPGHPPDEYLSEHEWRRLNLATALDMPHATLHTWVHRCWVRGHRDDTPQHAWARQREE